MLFLFQLSIPLITVMTAFYSYTRHDPLTTHHTKPSDNFAATISTSLLWVLLFTLFIMHESASTFITLAKLKAEAKKNGKKPPSFASVKYGSSGGLPILRAKRTTGNFLEQSLPFLLGVWLHAFFVSPYTAGLYGWCWLSVRSFYPLVYGRGGALFAVTVPNYVLIGMLFYPLISL